MSFPVVIGYNVQDNLPQALIDYLECGEKFLEVSGRGSLNQS